MSNWFPINEIHQIECLEGMSRLPEKSIDLILCDLPYGLTQNGWDCLIDLSALWKEYGRILRNTGVAVLTASQPFSSLLLLSNLKMFKHEWIWIKDKGSNFANVIREPMKEHEHVLVFANKKWTYNRQLQERLGSGKSRVKYSFKNQTASTNYRVFDREGRRSGAELRVPSSWQYFKTERGLHPNQKPVELFRYLIRTYSNEDDVVLDNCIGSGTTALAAVLERRNFIGFDIDKDYVRIANDRVGEVVVV